MNEKEIHFSHLHSFTHLQRIKVMTNAAGKILNPQ